MIKLSENIDSEKVGRPSFIMVLTAGEFAYQRKDGVWAEPLGCSEIKQKAGKTAKAVLPT